MKRFHVDAHVDDLQTSVAFYSTVRGDHLGIQTDTDEELAELTCRAQAVDLTLLDEGAVSCCHARSERHWVMDPRGIAWEHFHTSTNIPVFSQTAQPAEGAAAKSCCATPAAVSTPVALPIK